VEFAGGWVEGDAIDFAESIDGAGGLQKQRRGAGNEIIKIPHVAQLPDKCAYVEVRVNRDTQDDVAFANRRCHAIRIAGEQKILDHRGIVVGDAFGALAQVGLARAYALSGDTDKARAAYNDFLTLWKDADPDIPILIEAKREYAKMQ